MAKITPHPFVATPHEGKCSSCGELKSAPIHSELSDVFNLHGSWRVMFEGRMVKATWVEKGPALSCLSLLKQGNGILLDNGTVKWNQ